MGGDTVPPTSSHTHTDAIHHGKQVSYEEP